MGKIPLEVNPTSNLCLHVYPSLAHHPFPHLDRMGLRLTVNSDDPALFNTTLVEEFQKLATEFGYAISDLARFTRNAMESSGAPKEIKAAMLNELDAWVKSQAPDAAGAAKL
ncbi:MAG: hypothetical protein IPK16_01050 [Anaerolineales bacterium]|nr:hypothetical protein [Anaerolineales bacterium]